MSTVSQNKYPQPGTQRVQAVPSRAEERVKIRAARLRLVTDRRLGKVTPEWVKDLAKKPV